MVGADQAYKTLGEAAHAAGPGDTVRITPGTYQDCAIWTSSDLTIEGAGAGVVLAGPVCAGKAIFVIRADHVTISGLTFAHARSPDGNGAGINFEGVDLTVNDATFLDNQDGILAGNNPVSTIEIRDSTFDRNGACEPRMGCAHGVYVGHIALLRIEHSHFEGTLAGHHIKSRALSTEVLDSHIEDGTSGTSSYLIDVPNGGALLVSGNVLEKGPNTENHNAVIAIGEEGALVTGGNVVIRDNTFTNDGPPTTLVRNRTAQPAQLVGNVLSGNTATPLAGPGSVR